MSLEKRFLLMLLFLALLLGTGIIIPGYFKMRTLELSEAKEYSLASSGRMLDQLNQQIDILDQAGVGTIEAYVNSSKRDLVEQFASSTTDPRVHKLALDLSSIELFGDKKKQSFDFNPNLLDKLSLTEASTIIHKTDKGSWLISSQPSSEWGWLLLSSMPTKEVYRESREYLWFVLLISFAVLALVGTLYSLLTKQLRLRLRRMLAQLELYKYGEFNKRLDITDPDEIGTLQKTINSVIDNVETEIDTRQSSEHLLQQDRRSAEQELIDKQEHLARIGYLTKNPINSIAGFVQLLSDTKLTEKQRKHLERITEANETLNTLINETFNQTDIPPQIPINNVEDEPIESVAELDILLIETDSLNMAYVKEILNHENCEVTAFATVEEALEHLNDNDSDLVVINIGTPATTYTNAIKHIRTQLPSYLRDLPVIALTTDANQNDVEHYITAGATAIIAKPFSPSELVRTIAKHLT